MSYGFSATWAASWSPARSLFDLPHAGERVLHDPGGTWTILTRTARQRRAPSDAPRTFITRKRIERAQPMMVTTKDSLRQIPCASGLTHQAHLTRPFRNWSGRRR